MYKSNIRKNILKVFKNDKNINKDFRSEILKQILKKDFIFYLPCFHHIIDFLEYIEKIKSSKFNFPCKIIIVSNEKYIINNLEIIKYEDYLKEDFNNEIIIFYNIKAECIKNIKNGIIKIGFVSCPMKFLTYTKLKEKAFNFSMLMCKKFNLFEYYRNLFCEQKMIFFSSESTDYLKKLAINSSKNLENFSGEFDLNKKSDIYYILSIINDLKNTNLNDFILLSKQLEFLLINDIFDIKFVIMMFLNLSNFVLVKQKLSQYCYTSEKIKKLISLLCDSEHKNIKVLFNFTRILNIVFSILRFKVKDSISENDNIKCIKWKSKSFYFYSLEDIFLEDFFDINKYFFIFFDTELNNILKYNNKCNFNEMKNLGFFLLLKDKNKIDKLCKAEVEISKINKKLENKKSNQIYTVKIYSDNLFNFSKLKAFEFIKIIKIDKINKIIFIEKRHHVSFIGYKLSNFIYKTIEINNKFLNNKIKNSEFNIINYLNNFLKNNVLSLKLESLEFGNLVSHNFFANNYLFNGSNFIFFKNNKIIIYTFSKNNNFKIEIHESLIEKNILTNKINSFFNFYICLQKKPKIYVCSKFEILLKKWNYVWEMSSEERMAYFEDATWLRCSIEDVPFIKYRYDIKIGITFIKNYDFNKLKQIVYAYKLKNNENTSFFSQNITNLSNQNIDCLINEQNNLAIENIDFTLNQEDYSSNLNSKNNSITIYDIIDFLIIIFSNFSKNNILFSNFKNYETNKLSIEELYDFFSKCSYDQFYLISCLISQKGRFLAYKLTEDDCKLILKSEFSKIVDFLLYSVKSRFVNIQEKIQYFVNLSKMNKNLMKSENNTESVINIVQTRQMFDNKNINKFNILKNQEEKLIKQIIITPLAIIYKKPVIFESNRLLREFDYNKFVRVSLREEDGKSKIKDHVFKDQNKVFDYYRNILYNGLFLGKKKYFFVAMTMNQMKLHSAWFVTPYFSQNILIGPDYIRNWLGDFSEIKNIGKYALRLGQALSSTIPTINIQEFIEIDDITRNGFIFSDGVGLISFKYAKKVSEELGLEYIPSAFQIRFGGYKGIVVAHPISKDDKIYFKEFQCYNNSDYNYEKKFNDKFLNSFEDCLKNINYNEKNNDKKIEVNENIENKNILYNNFEININDKQSLYNSPIENINCTHNISKDKELNLNSELIHDFGFHKKSKLNISPELILRKSMRKFNSTHNNLECITYSSFNPCFINRQIINLLEGLKIDVSVFIEYQDKYFLKIMKEIYENPLLFVKKYFGILPYKEFIKDTKIFKKLLLQVSNKLVKDIIKKNRIFIEKGAVLMGTLDELCILEQDEVFIKIEKRFLNGVIENSHFYKADIFKNENCKDNIINSKNMNISNENFNILAKDIEKCYIEEGEYCIVIGSLIICKNPCLHPGDIQIAKGVYKKELSYLRNVLVFSQKGNRPISNMCSGSDLDGDMYTIIWDKSFIPKNSYEPSNYGDHTFLSKEIVSLKDVVNFYIKYIRNYHLGRISHAHMVSCDINGITNDNSILLAELFNKSIDFPKTGFVASVPESLIPVEYPDFMQINKTNFNSSKSLNIYESYKSLGILYRRSKSCLVHKKLKCECTKCIKKTIKEFSNYIRIIFEGSKIKSKCLYENFNSVNNSDDSNNIDVLKDSNFNSSELNKLKNAEFNSNIKKIKLNNQNKKCHFHDYKKQILYILSKYGRKNEEDIFLQFTEDDDEYNYLNMFKEYKNLYNSTKNELKNKKNNHIEMLKKSEDCREEINSLALLLNFTNIFKYELIFQNENINKTIQNLNSKEKIINNENFKDNTNVSFLNNNSNIDQKIINNKSISDKEIKFIYNSNIKIMDMKNFSKNTINKQNNLKDKFIHKNNIYVYTDMKIYNKFIKNIYRDLDEIFSEIFNLLFLIDFFDSISFDLVSVFFLFLQSKIKSKSRYSISEAILLISQNFYKCYDNKPYSFFIFKDMNKKRLPFFLINYLTNKNEIDNKNNEIENIYNKNCIFNNDENICKDEFYKQIKLKTIDKISRTLSAVSYLLVFNINFIQKYFSIRDSIGDYNSGYINEKVKNYLYDVKNNIDEVTRNESNFNYSNNIKIRKDDTMKKKNIGDLIIKGMFDTSDELKLQEYFGIKHIQHKNIKVYIPKLLNKGYCEIENHKINLKEFFINVYFNYISPRLFKKNNIKNKSNVKEMSKCKNLNDIYSKNTFNKINENDLKICKNNNLKEKSKHNYLNDISKKSEINTSKFFETNNIIINGNNSEFIKSDVIVKNLITITIYPGKFYIYDIPPSYLNEILTIETLCSSFNLYRKSYKKQILHSSKVYFLNTSELMDKNTRKEYIKRKNIKFTTKIETSIFSFIYKNIRYHVYYQIVDGILYIDYITKGRFLIGKSFIINENDSDNYSKNECSMFEKVENKLINNDIYKEINENKNSYYVFHEKQYLNEQRNYKDACFEITYEEIIKKDNYENMSLKEQHLFKKDLFSIEKDKILINNNLVNCKEFKYEINVLISVDDTGTLEFINKKIYSCSNDQNILNNIQTRMVVNSRMSKEIHDFREYISMFDKCWDIFVENYQ